MAKYGYIVKTIHTRNQCKLLNNNKKGDIAGYGYIPFLEIWCQGRSKFIWNKFEHVRFLHMTRRVNYRDVIHNRIGTPVKARDFKS